MVSKKQLFLNYIAKTSDSPMMLEIERAQGVFMYAPDGRDYIDMISGVSVCTLGHSHPKIVEAVMQQAEKYMHLMVYGEFVESPQVKFAEKLISMLPSNFENVYIVNSGSEATEGSLKLAKRYTGRPKVVSCKKAYHGSTIGSMSVMGGDEFKRGYYPLMPETYLIEFNNFDDLQTIDNQTACVLVEPIQGEAGIILPQNDYLKALRKRCDEVGALLIFDEVQTAFGRTGKMFAFENFDVVPDIINFAKGIGGGMPMGAFVSSQKIMSVFTNNPVLGHITTFGGHPVCCAASLAFLTELQANQHLITQAEAKGQLYRSLLKHDMIKEIRGIGLFLAVELKGNPQQIGIDVVWEAMNQGLVMDTFLFNTNSVRITPPLTITEDEIRLSCERLLKALEVVAARQ